jgi:hypothetical protein
MCVTCVAKPNLRIMILFSVSNVSGSGAIPPARLVDRLRIFSMSTRLSNNSNKYPPCVLIVLLATASVILQPYMTIVMTRILHLSTPKTGKENPILVRGGGCLVAGSGHPGGASAGASGALTIVQRWSRATMTTLDGAPPRPS